MHKKYIITAVVIFAITLCIVLVVVKSKSKVYESRALEISSNCGDNREKCLKNEIVKYVILNPEETKGLMDAFWRLTLDKRISDSPDFFLELVHDIGMTLVGTGVPLVDALEYCGYAFKQGCIHGVIMEYVDFNQKIISSHELFDLCDSVSSNFLIYLNCLHGSGHVFASQQNMPLHDLVYMCDSLPEEEEKIACSSGVFMEYSKGEAGMGTHSHQPLGSIALSCSQFETLYQKVCSVYDKPE